MLKVATHGRMAALDLRLLGRDPGEDAKLAAAADPHRRASTTPTPTAPTPTPTSGPGRCRSCSATWAPRQRVRATPGLSGGGTPTTSCKQLLVERGVPAETDPVRPRGPQRQGEGRAVRRRPQRRDLRPPRLDREDGRRHQRPSPRDRPAPPRLPVAAGRHRAARRPHPAPGQPEPRGRDHPLRHRRQSFDAYLWQTVERKARFIGQVMRGRLDVREIEDIGDTALSYGEVKALATGDPLHPGEGPRRRRD